MSLQRYMFLLFIVLFTISACTKADHQIVQIVQKETKHGYSVLFLGDIMFDWAIKDANKIYGLNFPLRKIESFLRSFDIVMANLETPLTHSAKASVNQKYVFSAVPEVAFVLANAGITAVTLANNHIMDYGVNGLMDTIRSLNDAKILYAGAGVNETTASLPILYSFGSLHIAILCYTQICSKEMVAKETPGVNYFELKKAQEDIRKYRYCNTLIVNIHWGNEYFYYPTSRQVEIAQALIRAGADAVIGHHPHVYQGVEIYKNKPIVYSLGNFLFGSIHEGVNDNIACALYLSPTGKIEKMRIYAIKGRFNDNHPQPEILVGVVAERVFDHLVSVSKPLGIIFPERVSRHDSYLEIVFK